MKMEIIQRDGIWYRRLRLRERVIATDYVDKLAGHVLAFRQVQGSVGYSVRRNRAFFHVKVMFYREIDPLIGQMMAARQKARRKRK